MQLFISFAAFVAVESLKIRSGFDSAVAQDENVTAAVDLVDKLKAEVGKADKNSLAGEQKALRNDLVNKQRRKNIEIIRYANHLLVDARKKANKEYTDEAKLAASKIFLANIETQWNSLDWFFMVIMIIGLVSTAVGIYLYFATDLKIIGTNTAVASMVIVAIFFSLFFSSQRHSR